MYYISNFIFFARIFATFSIDFQQPWGLLDDSAIYLYIVDDSSGPMRPTYVNIKQLINLHAATSIKIDGIIVVISRYVRT